MKPKQVPTQSSPSWKKVSEVAVKSLRKRAIRASMTMISVVLSIAFLACTWLGNDVILGLKALQDPDINSMLLRMGVDLSHSGTPAKTQWLIMLSLMVSAVGILNAMLMSVSERVKEIGTMKCIGATNGFIVKLFVVEAGIQGSIGTILGIVVGVLIAVLQASLSLGSMSFSAFPVLGGLESLGMALTIGVGMTVTFALYPAYMAANMLPVEAMRVEE